MTLSALRRVRAPALHILALIALATTVNATAISPALLGPGATVPLAALTLMVAALEWPIRGLARRAVAPGGPSAQEADVLRAHSWACGLAALVSVVSAGASVLA